MRRLLLILIGLSVCSQAPAEIPAVYLRSDNHVIIDHHAFSPEFFTGRFDLGERLASNSEAQQEYLMHRKLGLWGGIFLWGSLVTLSTYTLIAINNNSYSPDVAIWLCFIPEFLAGALMLGASRYHLLKAVNLYNGIPNDQAIRDITGERLAVGTPVFAPSLGLKWRF